MKYKNITQKKGDGGFTDLCLGVRVPKTDLRIKVVGKIDTFHAAMGLCHQYIVYSEIYSDFVSIQKELPLLMGEISSEDVQEYHKKFGGIDQSHLDNLDRILTNVATELDDSNHQQRGWAYYGERGPAAAQLDYAGTVCRECELAIVEFHASIQPTGIRSVLLQYMNRLSKVLYLYARKMEE